MGGWTRPEIPEILRPFRQVFGTPYPSCHASEVLPNATASQPKVPSRVVARQARRGFSCSPSGGRTWWAHLEFTPINIKLTILPKKIEDYLEFWKSSVLCSIVWGVRVFGAAATVSGSR